MSNQLLPCPFCGGSASYQRLRDGSKYGAYECGECGAQGPDVRTGYGPEEEWRDKATAAWNERSAATPPAAAHGDDAPGTVRVTADWLKTVHRDLDACQKVIWLAGCRPRVPGGFDPAYCEDAQARLKEIDEHIASAQGAGEVQ